MIFAEHVKTELLSLIEGMASVNELRYLFNEKTAKEICEG